MTMSDKASAQITLQVSVNGASEIAVNIANKLPLVSSESVQLIPLSPHEGLLIDASGKQERVFACLRDPRENRWDVWFQGATHSVVITDPKAKKSGRRSGSVKSTSDSPDIKAPMPGTILQIKAAVGDTVTAGQTLLIMESMKMEMTLKAATDGVVKEICCQDGQMVDMGTVLIQIQPNT